MPIGPSHHVGDIPPFSPYPYGPGIVLPTNPPKTFPSTGTNTFLVNKEPNTMDVNVIWVRDAADQIMVVDALDAEGIAGDPDAWNKLLETAYANWGAENVRITVTGVDFDKVQAAFEPTRV